MGDAYLRASEATLPKIGYRDIFLDPDPDPDVRAGQRVVTLLALLGSHEIRVPGVADRLGQPLDGAVDQLLVVKLGESRRDEVRRALKLLGTLRSKVIGVVITNAERPSDKYDYYSKEPPAPSPAMDPLILESPRTRSTNSIGTSISRRQRLHSASRLVRNFAVDPARSSTLESWRRS